MKIRRELLLFGILMAFVLPSEAAKPSTTLSPSAMVYGSFNGGYVHQDLFFGRGDEVHRREIAVPRDGAWFFGDSRYGSLPVMDCNHRYTAALTPADTTYDPFFTVGMTSGDVCTFGQCSSCRLNFAGRRDLRKPVLLSAGLRMVSVTSENGGGSADGFLLWLAQVNADAMQSMRVVETKANDDATPIDDVERNARAYVAASDDVVPISVEFLHNSQTFPPTPETTFTALWDSGATVGVMKDPSGVLHVPIPRMKTGTHVFAVTATLPSGKTYTADASVFVYNAALEVSINAAVFAPATAITFTRTNSVRFRVQQQDTKGKALRITSTDWRFRPASGGAEIASKDEVGFASDSSEWGGIMVDGGLVVVRLTLQTGKVARTIRTALTMVTNAQARTGAGWTTPRTLCEDCYDDLGIRNGGSVSDALFFPSIQNALNAANFPGNGGGGVTFAISGETS